MNNPDPLPLGHLVMTAGVHNAATVEPFLTLYASLCVERHSAGDWGELDPEDHEANEHARQTGGRILSSYPLPEPLAETIDEPTLWIITEADRSSTCLLWPHEY